MPFQRTPPVNFFVSMSLVRGMGLNKPHNVPHAPLARKQIRIVHKNPEQVFGWAREGAFDSKASSRNNHNFTD